MKILYINNDGGGFADRIEIADGTTVQSLFTQRLPNGPPENYLIRVNRQPASNDQLLQEGARKQQISKPKNSNKVKRLKKNRNTLRQRNTFLNSTPSEPVLRFTPYAWAKLLWLRDAGPTEIGGFGIAPSDNPLLIEDLRLVNQVTTAVTVQFDDAAVADLFDDLVDAGLRPDQFARVWIHTHPGESALPSSVDHETFERCFGNTDWAVMAILARGGETFASLRFHVGPGSTIPVPIQVAWEQPFSGTNLAAWQEEYAACVRQSELFADEFEFDELCPEPEWYAAIAEDFPEQI